VYWDFYGEIDRDSQRIYNSMRRLEEAKVKLASTKPNSSEFVEGQNAVDKEEGIIEILKKRCTNMLEIAKAYDASTDHYLSARDLFNKSRCK
jgi:hypothetical protein